MALIVTAVSRFLIPFFATDQGGSRFQTLHGTIHMILAVLAFGGLIWAATGLWGTLKHYPAWHGAESFLTIVPWVMLGSVVALLLAMIGPRLHPFFGVFERLFYLSSLAWMLVVAIELARISSWSSRAYPRCLWRPLGMTWPTSGPRATGQAGGPPAAPGRTSLSNAPSGSIASFTRFHRPK